MRLDPKVVIAVPVKEGESGSGTSLLLARNEMEDRDMDPGTRRSPEPSVGEDGWVQTLSGT